MDASFEIYQSLRDQAIQAGQEGRWADALPLFESAWSWAGEHGDQELADRAFCNLSIARIELGHTDGCIARLGEILLRTRDLEGRWIATYNIARAYELEKNVEKGLLYARRARDQAGRLGRNDLLASSYNRIGNLLLIHSQWIDAAREYEAALEALDGRPGIALGKVLDNLGYCRVLAGRPEEAFHLLFRSWQILSRCRTPEPLLSLRLDLSFAYLEINRYGRAARHAAVALDLARHLGAQESIKNALYLLGESANLAGDVELARRHFSELQEYYPNLPVVTDLLLAIDVRKLINLRA